jgi:hypothetical protein
VDGQVFGAVETVEADLRDNPPMNLFDRLKAAWKKHDEQLAEDALREQPKDGLYAPLQSRSDEEVHEHEQLGERD